MFEKNPKTLGRTTSSWTHRLSFGELLTFQKAKLLGIIAGQGIIGNHYWGTHLIKFGHFTFYTKLLDDNINMSALIKEMSWFCRFLFVVFTMSREPLLTKFSCVDAPPLKKLPKKTRRSFWQETISTWSPPCYSDTNSSNNSHWGFKSCRWNFRKEQIYSLESDIYTWAWGQNNFPRAGEVAIVGTNFKRQHWSCKFYTGKLSTTSHRCNWEKGIVVTEF